MRICQSCLQPKDDNEYNYKYRGKRVDNKCFNCHSKEKSEVVSRYMQQSKEKKRKTKEKVRIREIANLSFIYDYLLSHPCVDCNESNPVILEFDHVRGEKKFTIGKRQGASRESIIEEIKKCDVRCANHHKMKTSEERNSYRYTRYMVEQIDLNPSIFK